MSDYDSRCSSKYVVGCVCICEIGGWEWNLSLVRVNDGTITIESLFLLYCIVLLVVPLLLKNDHSTIKKLEMRRVPCVCLINRWCKRADYTSNMPY